MLRAFDPPQTSVESPAQGVAQLDVSTPPLSNEFPQKHYVPNSMPAYRYPSRLALLHRVPGNVIRDSQRARLGRVGVAAQTLPDRHNDIQTERAEAATNLQSIRRTSNVTLRRGDRGRVVHYRRAAEALRSELHACVGEAGLGAGGLVGLHRVAGDENGGFQGAVVGVVRVAAEGAPAEGRVDAAEIAVYRTGSFDWTTADPRNFFVD
ncbi:beta-1,3-glucan-binding protein [Aspergillus lentulus]|uniref:beta-1,3-glucan-binding protein n=1 Tax=Aspergillus lentulus TaxID=293939 RepID=UPI001393D656|nr:beta-1,3-glucan-binding protein [Aspergillus lentulus]GFF42389.1 beta-1,3-glucan-binding protein [Aspergillus lentulus]